MGEICFLLDENVDPLYRRELLKRAPEMTVWRIGEPGAPPLGTPDPEILRWCEGRGFLLVTNDRKSMPAHVRNHLAEGRRLSGILELHPKIGIGESIDDLHLIWMAAEPEDFQDLIVYLPLS